MSDTKPPPTKAEVMPLIANGINNALAHCFGHQIEFVLIVALPSDDPDYVELSTITGITDPGRLRAVARHVNDLATQHVKQGGALDPDSNADVRGNA